MLKVDQVNSIICLVQREGKSYSEVGRILDIDPRTVAKYANLKDHSPKLQTKHKSAPVMDAVKPIIDQWLEEDMKAPKKQRHTARRIFDRLCEEYDFTGSDRSVRHYVRQKKLSLYGSISEEYLPLVDLPGEAEFDFGEVMVSFAGQEVKMQEAVLTFPHSNAGFSQLFFSNNQECVLEFLKRVFHFVGGVPGKVLFDNLSPVVYRDKEGTRIVTDGVQRFANHYGFKCVFCNPASGNEKGNVENKVGYIRRNWYTPMPHFRDAEELEAFNRTLFDKSIKDMNRTHYAKDKPIKELWLDDLKHMHVLPEVEYECYRLEQFKTDKRGLVHIEKNVYSTRPGLAGHKIWAKLYHDHIEILDEQYQPICTHSRSYGSNTRLIDWSIYLQALGKKPRALLNTDFYQALPEPWQKHLVESTNLDDVLKHLEAIIRRNNVQYAPGIRALLEDHNVAALINDLVPPPDLPPYQPDLSVYDNLLRGGQSA